MQLGKQWGCEREVRGRSPGGGGGKAGAWSRGGRRPARRVLGASPGLACAGQAALSPHKDSSPVGSGVSPVPFSPRVLSEAPSPNAATAGSRLLHLRYRGREPPARTGPREVASPGAWSLAPGDAACLVSLAPPGTCLRWACPGTSGPTGLAVRVWGPLRALRRALLLVSTLVGWDPASASLSTELGRRGAVWDSPSGPGARWTRVPGRGHPAPGCPRAPERLGRPDRGPAALTAALPCTCASVRAVGPRVRQSGQLSPRQGSPQTAQPGRPLSVPSMSPPPWGGSLGSAPPGTCVASPVGGAQG